jgi:hypothetical protein
MVKPNPEFLVLPHPFLQFLILLENQWLADADTEPAQNTTPIL